MKPPPFIVGAAALFWGWQTDFFVQGAVMALVLESPRLIRARWEFSDEDVSRIWTFCSVLFLAAIVYAFASNDGVSNFAGLFQDPDLTSQRRAGESGSRTAVATIRWLPMMVFLFVAAQSYNAHERMPLATISLIYRMRLRRTGERRDQAPAMTTDQIRYSYLAACLFSACASTRRDWTFFAGFVLLIGWVLWRHRSRRFRWPWWAAAMTVAVMLSYAGQRGILQVQRLVNQYNPQWFSGWSQRGFDPEKTRTGLGDIGEMKTSGRIMIRLKTADGQAPPGLLREASYRRYRSLAWVAGDTVGQFQYLSAESDGTTWQLLPDKTNTASVNIACALPGQRALLPLPPGSARLEQLPDFLILSSNQNGAVLAEQSGLVIFDAQYGPGATIDAPFDPETDLAVPEREAPALAQVVEELLPVRSEREAKLRAVMSFFADGFGYSLWQDPPRLSGTNDTPLSRFLLETRSGHCEYFATATVLMLRQIGVPARYAVGYAVHEGSGNHYVARQRDAHAWCLVWNEETATWEDFDTTPGSWIAEEGRRASMFQWLADGWSRFKFEIAKIRWGQTNIRAYLFWLLIPGLLFLLYQIVFRRRKRRRRPADSVAGAGVTWPGLDSEFYHLETRLRQLGFERREGEPAAHWLERVTERGAMAGLHEALQAVLHLHYRLRFDPRGLPGEARTALRQQVERCLEDLRRPGSDAVRR